MNHCLIICFLLTVFVLNGCKHEPRMEYVMNAELVSMTERTLPRSPPKKGRRIKMRWCNDEKKAADTPEDTVGVIDQAIAKAQKKFDAKYIVDVAMYAGNECGEIHGNVVR
jgi:hypothetical protein